MYCTIVRFEAEAVACLFKFLFDSVIEAGKKKYFAESLTHLKKLNGVII